MAEAKLIVEPHRYTLMPCMVVFSHYMRGEVRPSPRGVDAAIVAGTGVQIFLNALSSGTTG
jgi:hypothetical protein